MSKKAGSVQRLRALRITGAVGAGAMVLGMVTVGAAVAADSGSGVRMSVTSPGAHKSREAAPRSLNGPGAHKSREATPVLTAYTPKKSREAAPSAN